MPLHQHSTFSLLDGIGLPEEHASATKEKKLPGGAITDHGHTAGWYAWEKAFKAEDLNALFGVETYWTDDRHIKDKDKSLFGSTPSHLVLIAKNREGLKSINRLVTASYLEGFYGKPRCDWEVLREHSNGVIATSACLGGPMGRYLQDEDIDSARSWASTMGEIFGDDFYLELQPHDIEEQRHLNKFLQSFGDSFPYIVTNDSHYPRLENKPHQEISVCIATGKKLSDENRMSYEFGEFYIKSAEGLYEDLQNHGGVSESVAWSAVENTLRLLRETKVDLPRGEYLMPGWENAQADLSKMVVEGFNTKLRKIPDEKKREYKERAIYEYNLICEKGFAEYFLVVADLVREAKNRGVFVGCGRGSAGGCLVSFLLSITEVDPIKWNLPLERFLSPHRGGYKVSFHSPKEITELISWYDQEVA